MLFAHDVKASFVVKGTSGMNDILVDIECEGTLVVVHSVVDTGVHGEGDPSMGVGYLFLRGKRRVRIGEGLLGHSFIIWVGHGV